MEKKTIKPICIVTGEDLFFRIYDECDDDMVKFLELARRDYDTYITPDWTVKKITPNKDGLYTEADVFEMMMQVDDNGNGWWELSEEEHTIAYEYLNKDDGKK